MPIEEYAKEAVTATEGGVAVCVEMKSAQRELTSLGLFADGGVAKANKLLSSDSKSADASGEYSLLTEGSLYVKEGRFYLSFSETLQEISEKVETLVSFELSDPYCVTVERRGEFSTAFTLCRGERLFSTYSTPFGVIDMCIFAKKVENTLGLEGGALTLDYAIELKGMTAQRTNMEIKVTKI